MDLSNIAEKVELSRERGPAAPDPRHRQHHHGHRRRRDGRPARAGRHRHHHRRLPLGTDVTRVNADLAGTLGGSAGDGAADTVVVNGTDLADTVPVTASGGVVQAQNGPTSVFVSNAEPAKDVLQVNTLAGSDSVSFFRGVSPLLSLNIDGGRRRRTRSSRPGRPARTASSWFCPSPLRPWTCPWTAAPPSPTSSPPM